MNRYLSFGSQSTSIRRDLTLSLVLTITIVFVLIGALFYVFSINQAEQELEQRTADTLLQLSDVLGPALWNVDDQLVSNIANAYLNSDHIVGIRVLDERFRLIYGAYVSSESVQEPQTSLVYFNEGPVGTVEVIATRESIITQQRIFLRSTAIVLIMVIIAVVLVTQLFLNRFLTKPLLKLSQSIDQIAGGDYEHLVPSVRQTEIDFIGRRVNAMAKRLSNLIHNLEFHVNEQTRDLQIAAAVTKQITTLLDLDELLLKLSQMMQESFDLYAVYVVLYDERTNLLNQTLAVRRDGAIFRDVATLNINARPSLAAKVARERTPLVINNIENSEDYRYQSIFPAVKAEAVLPTTVGNTLIGLLGLQSDQAEHFTSDNQAIFTVLAEQIGIAVQNARLYAIQVNLAEELKVVDQMKSQFLAGMSHELRTPLNAILNLTEMTALGVLGPINDKQREALGQAVESGQHLLSLINDVLDITKIQSGKVTLFVEEDIDLYHELKTVITATESLINNKPIEFIIDIAPDLPPIMVDRRRLKQILFNILSNAVKFTEAGHIIFRVEKQADDILFTVSDTGPGIGPEGQAHVFEPFMQTMSGIQHGGGTGLGMPISKNLAEAHGGKMWLESIEGQGTTFYVTMPVQVKKAVVKQELVDV